MTDETKKYIERTIERLKEIHGSSTPWNVRQMLAEFISKLEKTLEV